MKKSLAWATRGAFWTLLLAAPLRAQDANQPAPTPSNTSAAGAATKTAPKSTLETVGTGELRVDGKISAILGAGVWQVEAVSWTSPRGVTTNFEELKNKAVKVGTNTILHPRGEEGKVPLRDVKLGSRVAIIGKNGPDGSLVAREVILLEGYGARKTVGTLSINPFSLALVNQSRAARDAGQLPKALDLANKAIATAQGLGDSSGEGLATQDKSLLHLDMDQPQEAFNAMKRIEAIGRGIGNSLLLSMGLRGQGGMLLSAGEFEKAIALLQEADTVSTNTESQIHLDVLSTLAAAYLASGDLTQGIATLGRVYPLEQANGKEADAGETQLLIAALGADDKPDAARQALTEAQPLIDRTTDERAKANLLGSAALLHWRLDEKEEAKTGFTAAATLLKAAGDEKSAQHWADMATALEGAPADWQSFWMTSSGLGAAVKKTKDDGAPPAN